MREVQFWLPSVAQTRLCLSSLIAVSLSYVMLFCYFFFVCCLSFVVVTWKTSCRASTSSHHGNYSAKAPPIESFPACSFCTSQGNLKSQCHLLNTLKCGPWSRLHVRWGDLPHVTSPIWGPHLHVNSPQVRRQDGWKLAKSLLLFRFFFFFFVFLLFIVGVDKNTKNNDAAILTERAWSIKADLLCGQKKNFFLEGPTGEI